MAHLSLDLLGAFAARLDGRAVQSFRSNKTRGLLAYLALEADRAHARSTLAALFWPETPDQTAAKNLRLTLHRLRAALDDAAPGAADALLLISRGQIQLSAAALTLDVARFSAALAEVNAHGHGEPQLCPACRQRLEQAVALYRGELLAGFGLEDAPPFEEWLLMQRERLAHQCTVALHTLAAACQALGDYERAFLCAARQIELDPFRETAYRQAMAALAASGQRSEALAWHQTCVRVLAEELGIEPDAETTALYQRISRGELRRPPPAALPIAGFPAQIAPFVGREAELEAIRSRLLDPASRLVTLTGLGGVGKTRLAIEAARSLVEQPVQAAARFKDGLVFVSLASIGSAELLPAALAAALGGLALNDDASVADQVIGFLRHRQLLLVLDNFEHLRKGAGWLRAVLEAAPGVEMLVTSRLPLDLKHEERLPLDGLTYPAPGAAVEQAADYPALRLFVQAARRVQHRFHLTPANVADVIRICAQVDGRPLALEIAASWLRVYDCAGIVREIERSFSFLATEQRDVPLRQRSIQTVFDHTWELLTPQQRRTLTDLIVLQGPFSLEAALAVSEALVIDVAALLDASLVQRRSDGWYEIHYLLRQLAGQKGQSHARYAELHAQALRRHSVYHLAYLADQQTALVGPQPHEAVAQVRRRLDDIRQAWRLAGETGCIANLEASLDGLARFYDSSGLIQEGGEVLEWSVLQVRRGAEHHGAAAPVAHLLSRLLIWQAHFLDRRGQGLAAIDLLEQAMPLAEQSGDVRAQSECHSMLGALLPHRGQFALAQQHQEQAVAAFRTLGDDLRLALALTRLGVLHWRRGSTSDAQAYLEEALTLQQRVQNRLGMAKILRAMGGVAFAQQQFDRALQHAQQARTIYASVGDRSSVAALDGNLALLSRERGDYQEALAYNQQDLDYAVETGDGHGEAVALGNRASILLDCGQQDAALACLERAIAIEATLDNAWEIARQRAALASILAGRSRQVEALAEYQRALPVLRAHGARYFLADPLLNAAGLLIDTGALDAARELAAEAGQLAGEMELAEQGWQARVLAALLDRQDPLAQLRQLAGQAQDPPQQASVHFWLWKLGQAETDRAVAERLYGELAAALPRYDYQQRLAELQRQTLLPTGLGDLIEAGS
jgi:DNA-binding SARP family transcriptional activator/predicted ATPase